MAPTAPYSRAESQHFFVLPQNQSERMGDVSALACRKKYCVWGNCGCCWQRPFPGCLGAKQRPLASCSAIARAHSRTVSGHRGVLRVAGAAARCLHMNLVLHECLAHAGVAGGQPHAIEASLTPDALAPRHPTAAS